MSGQQRNYKRNPNKVSHEERLERSRENQKYLAALKGELSELKERVTEDTTKVCDALEKFDQLPLSGRTKTGLAKGNFKFLTHIQAAALPHALTGRDVLGAAKTGSGKTLSYLVPVIERLHTEAWDGESGLGALVLTPTRELALQIFKVLQVVGCKHPFAAALLTGGRNVDEEKKRLGLMAVVVGTPGRLLHHLSESSTLNVDNLQMLVLDEADRLLDMGFYDTVTGILDQLPQSETRQTLLFSATQSNDVSALARLALRDPVTVSAHAAMVAPTPQKMNQNFMVVPLEHKLDALLAFIKRHPNDKTIVFVNTCNQVRFMYLTISKLLRKYRVPTMCLTGKMKQFRRDEVFTTFCRCRSAVLFCTDIAARGLDFPLVHWVFQYDCPESVDTYIHRAGRTARAGARGVSVLMLTPQETNMLYFLNERNVPLREIGLRANVVQDTTQLFVALVVQGLKFEAQKAFTSYLRSVKFASNKAVFDVSKIDVEAFSQSLGLLVVPDTSGLSDTRSAKNLPWDVANYKASMEGAAAAKKETKTRRERHLEATDMFDAGMTARLKFTAKERLEEDADDDLLVKKVKPSSERAKKVAPSSRTAFAEDSSDDDGEGQDGGDDLVEVSTKKQAKKQQKQADPAAAEEELTYDERLAGLSKHKMRKLVKTADLRIKELHLSKHKVFGDSDDDEDSDAGAEARNEAGDSAAADLRSGRGVTVDDIAVDEDDDDDDDLVEQGYAANLRSRLQATTKEDADRVRALKRERRGKKLDRDGDDDGFSSSGDDSDVSMDSATQRLIRAAGGESVSSEDDDDDDFTDASSADDAGPSIGATLRQRKRRQQPADKL